MTVISIPSPHQMTFCWNSTCSAYLNSIPLLVAEGWLMVVRAQEDRSSRHVCVWVWEKFCASSTPEQFREELSDACETHMRKMLLFYAPNVIKVIHNFTVSAFTCTLFTRLCLNSWQCVWDLCKCVYMYSLIIIMIIKHKLFVTLHVFAPCKHIHLLYFYFILIRVRSVHMICDRIASLLWIWTDSF